MNPNQYKIIRPNLFLMGGAKCATTSISSMLGQHPKILLSCPKETNFFQRDTYQKGMDWYSKEFFRGANKESYFMDATPEYSIMRYVLPRIRESCIEPKFIFIIMEPIEREYSHYIHKSSWRIGRCCDTFSEEIKLNLLQMRPDRFKYERDAMSNLEAKGASYNVNIIEHGNYYDNISRCIKMFGKENVFCWTI